MIDRRLFSLKLFKCEHKTCNASPPAGGIPTFLASRAQPIPASLAPELSRSIANCNPQRTALRLALAPVEFAYSLIQFLSEIRACRGQRFTLQMGPKEGPIKARQGGTSLDKAEIFHRHPCPLPNVGLLRDSPCSPQVAKSFFPDHVTEKVPPRCPCICIALHLARRYRYQRIHYVWTVPAPLDFVFSPALGFLDHGNPAVFRDAFDLGTGRFGRHRGRVGCDDHSRDGPSDLLQCGGIV